MAEGTTPIPAQLQEQLGRLQQFQQTLQVIMSQKQQVELELSDTDRALEELQKMAEDAAVYQMIGSILVKKDRGSVLKDLTEKKELLNVRVSVLGKQEGTTKDKLRELQQRIQSKLGSPKSRPAT